MGKSKKLKISKGIRNISLDQQITDGNVEKPSQRIRLKQRDRKDEDEEYVGSELSKRILQQARAQQQELEDEVNDDDGATKQKSAPRLSDPFTQSDEEEEEPPQQDSRWDCYDNIEVNEEDEKALGVFMTKDPAPRRTLADIIMEKITEKQTELHTQFSDAASIRMEDLDPRVKEMYEGVRDVLRKYRSGRLPKAFKVIPHLSNWEQVLYLTDPSSWTAAAMYQGTRIFASNLKEKMAQRFYNLVLLPRVRDDIAEYKRLNFHLYQALRKSIFKPGAFMKGILLPLCESGTCTLREAIIIGSVISRNSIPMLHSAAAILKIAEMDYSGANSVFLRILIDKKYALPFRVVDAVVYHFIGFVKDVRDLPVLWHQSLLAFVQHYKSDLSSEQKGALYALLRAHFHPTITLEVRRELIHSKPRDEETAECEMK